MVRRELTLCGVVRFPPLSLFFLCLQVDLLGGGARLKSAYDEAKANSDAKEEEFTKSFEHKRFLTKERNQMKQQKEEAEQYNTILEQFKASKVNLTLFQLFHLHHDIEKKKAEAKQQQKVTTRTHRSTRGKQ